MNRLNLMRPLCFIDLEATGLDRENDRIVEISILKMDEEGEVTVKTRRINPEMPIPAQATEIHGITDQDVTNEPTFKRLAKGLHDFIKDCDLAGYNSNAFDFPMLYAEFRRAGIEWEYSKSSMVDVGNIFKIREPRTLEAAVKFYTGQDHENAHGAEADVRATVAVFFKQIFKYTDLPETIEELALLSNHGKPMLDLSGKFSIDVDGDVIFNFGPHRGKKAKDELSFVQWMYSKDFPPDTKAICNNLLNKF